MNLFMNLKNFKKCRLWINDTTHGIEIKLQNKVEKSIVANTTKSMDTIKVAIELALPKNASNYALIGFEYVPNKTVQNKTIVSVCLNNELRDYDNQTLAKIDDKVVMGICNEYGDSILESAIEYINSIGVFPPGEVIFNIGAHAECGSSRAIFEKATEIILMISQFDLENMTNEVIQKEIELLL
ncbi:hypothetical protein KPL40_15875 [Clostridium gasigenes]|uniref:hypothetical protein n=1 Tax=Clostridium gasigenes TaxID=94869 RepID=UPI001C0C970D|nr:hypothetical protein [Clostridium gasigenes]MBU3133908.1 hypothetical protein [Clostridium gasigenes]